MKSIIFFLFINLCILFNPAIAQNFKNEFGFRSDNDAYLAYGQDQYYTNGLFISFRHALPYNQKHTKKIWEAEFGQYMYNASTGNTRSINEVDRPFAAYLYGGLKMNWFKENEEHFQTGLQLGTIGPNAYGKEVQETLHNIVGFYEIRGWEYQVNNEFEINTSFNYNRLISRNAKNDFSLNTYANIGTTFTGLGAGILFRTGNFNKFNSSISSNSRISNSKSDSSSQKELFFYARPLLNFVGYNSTIQGGMFVKDKGPIIFTPNRFLFTQELGLMFAKNRWSLNFSVIFQTKDLKEQREAHEYGSASIFYRFN